MHYGKFSRALCKESAGVLPKTVFRSVVRGAIKLVWLLLWSAATVGFALLSSAGLSKVARAWGAGEDVCGLLFPVNFFTVIIAAVFVYAIFSDPEHSPNRHSNT